MSRAKALKKEVMEKLKDDRVDFITLQFIDIFGTIKNVTIPASRLEEAIDRGVWFDGSSIQGFARIYETDMLLLPEVETYCLLPWEKGNRIARMFCEVRNPDGTLFDGDPRYILKKACQRAGRAGYIYNTGPEFEFFLFKKQDSDALQPVPHDVGGYFDFSPLDEADVVRQEIAITLEKMGISVEKMHHEVAIAQHEVDIVYGEALPSADNVSTVKYVIKAIAALHGLYATFMPKPLFGVNGSGMHVHQSLFDEKGNNLFFDPSDPYKISKKAYKFIAGQFEHADGISALIAPTVNSYKRLVPGYEAPVYICWAQINRSALIRIPRFVKGREKSTRLELRCPDPSANPYLAFAAMLDAGMDGIERRLNPGNPVEENVFLFDANQLREKGIRHLPTTLLSAIEALENDALLKKTLGTHCFEMYIRAKRSEWNEYARQITNWELERYLDAT